MRNTYKVHFTNETHIEVVVPSAVFAWRAGNDHGAASGLVVARVEWLR